MTQLIDVSSETYHKIDRLSSSRLMEFDNDREEYEARYVKKVRKPRGTRDALVIGGALHTLVLEGRETFEKEYALEPKTDRRTKAGKAAHAEFESANAGREVVTASQWELVSGMAEKLANNSQFTDLLRGSYHAEQGMLFEMGGVDCKAKPDLYGVLDGKPTLIDLKTTQDAHPSKFKYSALDYGYPQRLAFYLEAICGLPGAPPFHAWEVILVAVDKNYPHSIGLFRIDDPLMEYARKWTRKTVGEIAGCQRSGVWVSPWASKINTLYLPKNIKTEEEASALSLSGG